MLSGILERLGLMTYAKWVTKGLSGILEGLGLRIYDKWLSKRLWHIGCLALRIYAKWVSKGPFEAREGRAGSVKYQADDK